MVAFKRIDPAASALVELRNTTHTAKQGARTKQQEGTTTSDPKKRRKREHKKNELNSWSKTYPIGVQALLLTLAIGHVSPLGH